MGSFVRAFARVGRYLLIGAVAFSLGSTTIALGIAPIPGPDGTIWACRDNKSGDARIVHDATECTAKESALQWNQKGPAGPTGATGPTGASGAAGATGPTGANGTNGAPGAAGATGATGPTGPNGSNGTNGAIGPTGPAGSTGPAGTNGVNGTNGATGPTGATGGTGPAGVNGTNGAAGPTGPAGANGATGPTGPTGPAGGGGSIAGITTVTSPGNAATCPTGKFALGGGGATTLTGSALTTSVPMQDSDGRSIGWTTQQTSGNPDGLTTYVICANSTPPAPTTQAFAPNDLSQAVGDFDGVGGTNDVRLTFTTPTGNTVNTYAVQRSALGSAIAGPTTCALGSGAPSGTDALGTPAGSTFATIGTVTGAAGLPMTFTDLNLTIGGYCYRVRAQNPDTSAYSFSNYAPANVVAPAPGITVSPDYSVDVISTASLAVPGTGAQTITFHFTGLSGNFSYAVGPSGNLIRNADGTFGFCDFNGDRKGDFTANTFILSVTGVPVGAPTGLVRNVPIPADGNVSIVIDSAARNQRVRVLAWRDASNDGLIDLTTAGIPFCEPYVPYDAGTDGAIAASGRVFFLGPEATLGTQFLGFVDNYGNVNCAPIFRNSLSNQTFSAGQTSATSLKFIYDANDVFRIGGAQISLDNFRRSITGAGGGNADTISINYSPGGVSEFEICHNAGAEAPAAVSASVGNFNGGSVADDVRLEFTVPLANLTDQETIQRASLTGAASAANCNLGAPAPSTSDAAGVPAGSSFSTLTTITGLGGDDKTFIDFNLAFGGYCYRVVVYDLVFGTPSYSNYVAISVFGAAGDTVPPTSTATSETPGGAGFVNTLDAGDRLVITFSERMAVMANATIRVTDSDCGTATNVGPAVCSGGNTNTVVDIICGTNATCSFDNSTSSLTATMTVGPSIVAAGAVAGAQFPIVVTDSVGITDLSGNNWDLTCGGQSFFGPPCANGTAPHRVIP